MGLVGGSALILGAIAAGAILAMIADTMIPEAFEYTHVAVDRLVGTGMRDERVSIHPSSLCYSFAGLITVCGFLTTFVLSKLGG